LDGYGVLLQMEMRLLQMEMRLLQMEMRLLQVSPQHETQFGCPRLAKVEESTR
jgi:hypothetical protein